jgi:hypothetical protein
LKHAFKKIGDVSDNLAHIPNFVELKKRQDGCMPVLPLFQFKMENVHLKKSGWPTFGLRAGAASSPPESGLLY